VIHPTSDQVQNSQAAISTTSPSTPQSIPQKLQEDNGVTNPQLKSVLPTQTNLNGESLPPKLRDPKQTSSPTNGSSHAEPMDISPKASKENELVSQQSIRDSKSRRRLRRWNRGESWFQENYRSPRIAGNARKGCMKIYLVTTDDDLERQFCLSWIKTNCRHQPGFTMIKEVIEMALFFTQKLRILLQLIEFLLFVGLLPGFS